MASLKDRLTDILIKNNLITPEQLNQALEEQRIKGGKLSDIIVALKFVSESNLISVLSQSMNFPLIDLKRFKVDTETARLVPSTIARHYQIIPVSKIGDTITLAMADPLNVFAIDHVASLTGYKINPIISSLQDIMQAIETSYTDVSKDAIGDLVKEISATSSIELIKEEREANVEADMGTLSTDAPVIKITDLILDQAVKKKSSDILIEPFEKKLRVRFRVDGILQEEQSPPKHLHMSIVSRIKVMSELNIAEHRLPQDGRFKAKLGGREVDFRVSVLPSAFGEKVAIRILDKSQAMLDIQKLGFAEDTLSTLRKVAKMPHGMVLVTGPTGSGKTTTLYSVLKLLDSPEKNIVTVEDPVEYQLEGINQVTVKADVGLTFASALRSILRQDPNIIMIGEIRDFETVDIAIKSALTGHLVLSTLHTTTACGSVVRLVNMGVEPFMINSSVLCIVAQRLVRKLCPYCKHEDTLAEGVIKNLKIAVPRGQKAVFYRGKGCSRCLNLGYSGRVGIAEVLLLTSRIRDLILNRAQEHIIKQHAREEGMHTLREDGIRAALAGLTSLEEIIRVTAADEV
ncbi:MAG TPA: ATPase, T2SS/T4P/T4SS family [Candidatus Omnitrophota bacterium]|nr:Flp pilus assembly complex ATPase component TadA [Candidatus Omnitrophota bacterium]MDD4940530.1 ATPase, T2SS/T4P/T4SS family [Candidatus Omnitrophota bacterium]HQO38399.1 ATPase, T2SS/T4P/T4SS family [Candidatus Omnitrophota bacterium]HQQ06495.1 ATPase, T2SS/T4P/T4SS family [Candidatus Omnitrophota bacterium]